MGVQREQEMKREPRVTCKPGCGSGPKTPLGAGPQREAPPPPSPLPPIPPARDGASAPALAGQVQAAPHRAPPGAPSPPSSRTGAWRQGAKGMAMALRTLARSIPNPRVLIKTQRTTMAGGAVSTETSAISIRRERSGSDLSGKALRPGPPAALEGAALCWACRTLASAAPWSWRGEEQWQQQPC